VPTYKAIPISPTRVRLVFSEVMRPDVELTNPFNYLILEPVGTVLTVATVEIEDNPAAPKSVVLDCPHGMRFADLYVLAISPNVRTYAAIEPLNPLYSNFQWFERPREMNIPIGDFSGEVSGGILGAPHGLVFFSPALSTPVSNSAIQVDSVTTCTRTFDVYSPPAPPDPPVLFTHGGTPSTLNNAVCYASASRLEEAWWTIEDHREDTYGGAATSNCRSTLQEQWDPNRVSLTNNPYWEIFDPASAHPFILADNLTPIPPGATSFRLLEP